MSEIIINNEKQDDLEGRYLTFYIEDVIYGVELLHVLEIIGMQTITKAPGVPYYIRGIINLRGKIVPVVDMRIMLNQPEKEYDERTCTIVVNLNDISVGLIVDRVNEVVSVSDDMISPPPDSGTGENNLKSIARVGEDIILNLDINKLLDTESTNMILN